MVTKRKVNGRAMSLPAGVGIGTVVALGWTLAASAVLAKLMDLERLPEDAVGYGAMGILLIAGYLGAVTAYAKVKGKRLQVSLITAAAYYVSLLAMTALFFGGQYAGMGVTALVILAGCGTAILLGLKSGGRKKGRRYRKINR